MPSSLLYSITATHCYSQGVPSSRISRLQRNQDTTARILTGTARHDLITPVLQPIHWLPVVQRVKYKTLILVYKAINNLAPKYLKELLQLHEPSRGLRSSHQNLRIEQFKKSPVIKNRVFSTYGPMDLWNALPEALRNVVSF